jgi:hexosaminidase
MSDAVIPAPGRFNHTGGEFVFQSGTTIAYINIDVGPIVERFCLEVTRRTGLRVLPMTGNPGSSKPSMRVELTTGDEAGVLPAPRGISPIGDRPSDEQHSLVIDEHRVVVRAAQPVVVARGLSTLIQLLATTPSTSASKVLVPATRIHDAPRYAWRGLSLDLARTFFTLEELQRVIDLLALYKLNVLHLHLTDDESWRLPVGRSAQNSKSDVTFYSAEAFRGLAAYAEDRFVTIVPEIDTPGHASALVRMRPENTGRNLVEMRQ